MDVALKTKIVFDPLYGFIHLTNLEWEIIHTPFYQRLRWIKQLGFTLYTFPGAEQSGAESKPDQRCGARRRRVLPLPEQ